MPGTVNYVITLYILYAPCRTADFFRPAENRSRVRADIQSAPAVTAAKLAVGAHYICALPHRRFFEACRKPQPCKGGYTIRPYSNGDETRRRGALYMRPAAPPVFLRPAENRSRVRADMQSAPTEHGDETRRRGAFYMRPAAPTVFEACRKPQPCKGGYAIRPYGTRGRNSP